MISFSVQMCMSSCLMLTHTQSFVPDIWSCPGALLAVMRTLCDRLVGKLLFNITGRFYFMEHGGVMQS